jgi:hypothetical protein
MKVQSGSRGTNLSSVNRETSLRWVVHTKPTITLLLRNSLGTHCTGGWVDWYVEKIISFPHRVRTPNRSARYPRP